MIKVLLFTTYLYYGLLMNIKETTVLNLSFFFGTVDNKYLFWYPMNYVSNDRLRITLCKKSYTRYFYIWSVELTQIGSNGRYKKRRHYPFFILINSVCGSINTNFRHFVYTCNTWDSLRQFYRNVVFCKLIV